MRVLIAPDKFKDALTAAEACEVIAAGLREERPEWALDVCPLTDGGEGFARILTEAARGAWVPFDVAGPRGTLVRAGFGMVEIEKLPVAARARLMLGAMENGRIAVIEMAQASGLALLSASERDVWRTDTRGTGELIAAAAARGVRGILLGVGGSATNDLGLGALAALGAKVLAADGQRVADCAPHNWAAIERVDVGELGNGFAPEASARSKLPPIWIACDVVNPLLGPRGAAAVYAPQKGLVAGALPALETASERMAGLLAGKDNVELYAETPGAGAAGGIAFGFMAVLGARLVPGFDLVTDWLSLENRLSQADLVITGEGRFDESSLQGKGAGSLANAARTRGLPVHVFAGRVEVGTGADIGSADVAEGNKTTARLHLHEISLRDVPLAEALAGSASALKTRVREVFASV